MCTWNRRRRKWHAKSVERISTARESTTIISRGTQSHSSAATVAVVRELKSKSKIDFKCGKNKICFFLGFGGKAHLERHIERMHEVDKRVVCDICGKSYSSQQTLNDHRRRHDSQAKKECPHCGKLVTDLKQHINVVHLGTRRGGIIRIPGLDSQGNPLKGGQVVKKG